MYLNEQQRDALKRIFQNKLDEQSFWSRLGPTTRATIMESLVFYFKHFDDVRVTRKTHKEGEEKVNYLTFHFECATPILNIPIKMEHEMPETELGSLQ